MQTLITLAQAVIFTAYVFIFIKRKYGKLTSISASSYSLKGNESWYFLLFLGSLAILNLFQGLGLWGWLTSVGLLFTGITIKHDGNFKPENTLHTIAAIASIAVAALGMFFLHGMLFPAVVLTICTLTLFKNRTFIWDIEVISFYTILFSYLLR